MYIYISFPEQGFFCRTIAMAKAGIKPLYVFDGKPPTLKSGEIANRNVRRELVQSRVEKDFLNRRILVCLAIYESE